MLSPGKYYDEIAESESTTRLEQSREKEKLPQALRTLESDYVDCKMLSPEVTVEPLSWLM